MRHHEAKSTRTSPVTRKKGETQELVTLGFATDIYRCACHPTGRGERRVSKCFGQPISISDWTSHTVHCCGFGIAGRLLMSSLPPPSANAMEPKSNTSDYGHAPCTTVHTFEEKLRKSSPFIASAHMAALLAFGVHASAFLRWASTFLPKFQILDKRSGD